MTRYDAQWPDVHAAEAAQEFRQRMTAWESAQRVAGFFVGVRDAGRIGVAR